MRFLLFNIRIIKVIKGGTYMDIGRKIRHLRLINNMTQEDVASQLFISRQPHQNLFLFIQDFMQKKE